jgi:cytochrome P450
MTDANQNVEPQAPVDTTLADLTLADPGVHRCPFGYYAKMQDESPVHYDRHTDLWMITRYDDVVSAAGAWERFRVTSTCVATCRTSIRRKPTNCSNAKAISSKTY